MNKRVIAKRTNKKAKIVKAAKGRGANEFGQVSKVSAPFKGVNTTSTWTLPQRKKADFKKWLRHDLWRIEVAIMLLLGLEPFDVKADYWNEPKEYADLYKLALGSQSIGTLKFHSATQVRPSVFVKWAISKGLDVPQELVELAKIPDIDTVAHSERQEESLPQSKQESEETSAQDTTTDAQNKEKDEALFIAGRLLAKDSSRRGVLDEVIGLAIRKAESMYPYKVWPELCLLSNEKKTPFTGGTKDGGLPYYGSSYAMVKRLNKKSLSKRLTRMKKEVSPPPPLSPVRPH